MEQLADGALLGEVVQIMLVRDCLVVCWFLYIPYFSYPESFPHSDMLASCKDTHSKLHNLSTVMNHLLYFSQVLLVVIYRTADDVSIFRHN